MNTTEHVDSRPAQATVLHTDTYQGLRELPDSSVDAVVTDPPYAIRPPTRPTAACANPGQETFESEWRAYAAADMLGQQSANWHAKATHSRGYADNDPAHFHRWCRIWLTECLRVLKPGGHLVAFGGTKTWHRLATAAEETGFEIRDSLAWLYATGFPKSVDVGAAVGRLARPTGSSGSDLAAEWHGWGTALKPAFEPIVLARAPFAGTVAANVAAHRTGAINVDALRLEDGRWPTNAFLDDHQAQALDGPTQEATGGDATRPSRFFWHSKPNQIERVVVDGVKHPTVKPLALMRELVRMVTPVGGTVLEPFAGSGTTVEACLLEGMSCIAFEREPSYIPLIEARVRRASGVLPVIESSESTEPGVLF